MAQFLPRLHAIYDEIKRIQQHIDKITNTEELSLNEKLFLATLYTNKLSQLEKEIKDIEQQVVD